MEEREGTITSAVNSKLRDSINGVEYEFVNPANVTVTDNLIAIYVTINTPNKVIRVIREIKQ